MATKEEQPKDPMDYTDIELETMRLSKQPLVQNRYAGIMKLRRTINRTKKAKAAAKRVTIAGSDLDTLRKDDPGEYRKTVKILGKQYKAELMIMINSTTPRPIGTIVDFKKTVRAIADGRWHPTTPQLGSWKPKRGKSAFDKHMDTE